MDTPTLVGIGIGVAVTLAIGLFGILATRHWGRQKYELSYKVLDDRRLDEWEDTSLIVEDEELSRPRFIRIHVENTGKADFAANDFEQAVEFVGDYTVVATRVPDKSARDMNVRPSSRGAEHLPLGFDPLLLKPGEWFVLEAYTQASEEGDRNIEVVGRVRGISVLRNLNRKPITDWKAISQAMALGVVIPFVVGGAVWLLIIAIMALWNGVF